MASRLDHLKTQREAAGLSQDELARKATVSLRTIVALEAPRNGPPGTCESTEAQQIADALGVSLATLGHADL